MANPTEINPGSLPTASKWGQTRALLAKLKVPQAKINEIAGSSRTKKNQEVLDALLAYAKTLGK